MKISKIFCSLHLQGDPNYIHFNHFKPKIRQNYRALPSIAKPMAYFNSLSNFLSENVNFRKDRAKNKKVMLYISFRALLTCFVHGRIGKSITNAFELQISVKCQGNRLIFKSKCFKLINHIKYLILVPNLRQ